MSHWSGDDLYFMRIAFEEAQEALRLGEGVEVEFDEHVVRVIDGASDAVRADPGPVPGRLQAAERAAPRTKV